MKGKVTVRLLSVLLTLAMLIGLMPAAFAASNLKYVEESMDSDDFLSLSFLDSNIPYYDYYIADISGDSDNGRYAPIVVDYWDESNWPYIEEDELDEYFFSSYDNSYGQFEYTIKIISEDAATEGERFYIYLTLYVDGGGSGYTDGEIYAETDAYGVLDLDYVAGDIYDIAYEAFRYGDPKYVYFTTSDGILNSREDGDGIDKDNVQVGFISYSYGMVLDEFVYFLIDRDLDKAEIEFTVVSDNNRDDPVYGTVFVSGGAFAGDIQYSTPYNTEVYFDSYDFEDLLTSSQTLEYVTFTQPSSKGTLYYGNSKVKSTDKFYSDDLDGVSFYPATGVSGNVTISFTLYYTTKNSTTPRPMNGTVSVSVDDGTTISYTGEVGVALEFDAADFDAVCYDVYGG